MHYVIKRRCISILTVMRWIPVDVGYAASQSESRVENPYRIQVIDVIDIITACNIFSPYCTKALHERILTTTQYDIFL